MSIRYAIYYAPEADTALADFGNRWLGRNPRTGRALVQPKLASIPAETLLTMTESPRRYGFHATLKPPFRLVDGETEETLLAAVKALANDTVSWDGPALRVTQLGDFLALRPDGPTPAIDALASDCVRALDHFRAPLTPEDIAKRRPATLTDRQRDNLQTWGYPHVMQDFRFHMTLTGPIPSLLRARAQIALVTRFQTLAQASFCVDALSVLRQSKPSSAFRLIARAPLKPAHK